MNDHSPQGAATRPQAKPGWFKIKITRKRIDLYTLQGDRVPVMTVTMAMLSGKQTEKKPGSNEAITAPLKIVRELYSKRASSLSDVLPGDFGVQAYFEELAGDESVAGEVRLPFDFSV
jgi:hypothetical protein